MTHDLILFSSDGLNPSLLLFGASITEDGIAARAYKPLQALEQEQVLYQLELINRPPMPPDWALLEGGLTIHTPRTLEPIDSSGDPNYALGIYWIDTNWRRI